MKNFIVLVLLVQSVVFAKSPFMQMCENPTPSQRFTLEVMSEDEYLGKYSKSLCSKIEKKYSQVIGISLFDTHISDLSPIQFFKQVKYASIQRNNITDITPLANLTNLEELDILNNPITDLTPIKNLKLKKLKINSNAAFDLSPLSEMKSLEDLFLLGDSQNFPDASKLINLESLWLTRIKVTSICLFENSKNLKSLHLGRNNISDLTCIENFQELETFELRDNPVTDLAPLQSLKKLKKLMLENVPVLDVTPLAKLKSLESFTFYDTEIKYLSPLKESTSLQYITNQNQFKFFTKRFLTGGFQLWYESIGHRSLASCSPETVAEIREGKTCFEEDGILKSWWKRKLGL